MLLAKFQFTLANDSWDVCTYNKVKHHTCVSRMLVQARPFITLYLVSIGTASVKSELFNKGIILQSNYRKMAIPENDDSMVISNNSFVKFQVKRN